MDLRLEAAGERDQVRAVHEQAFGDHGPVVGRLSDALFGTGARSLVAVVDGRIVGNVMFSRNRLDAPRELVDVEVLSPVGVLPAHQRRGVGSALIRHGLEIAAAAGAPAVFLEGDPGYYRRLGFAPAGDIGFRKPSLRIPDPAFQVHLLPAHEQWMVGTLVYHHAFWDHDCVGLRDQ